MIEGRVMMVLVDSQYIRGMCLHLCNLFPYIHAPLIVLKGQGQFNIIENTTRPSRRITGFLRILVGRLQ